MKKFISIIAMFSLSLSACGNSNENKIADENSEYSSNLNLKKDKISGSWIFSGQSCNSGSPINFEASGKYSTEGELGKWVVNGNDIVITVTETFDGETTQKANERYIFTILKSENDTMFLRTPGGEYMAYRCPDATAQNNTEANISIPTEANTQPDWSTVQAAPNFSKGLIELLEGDSASNVRIALVKLKSGGVDRWDSVFVYNANSSACGSAGCSLEVYDYSSGSPANILSVKTGAGLDYIGVSLGKSQKNGMKDIILNDGPTWSWNGKVYTLM